MNVDTLIHDVNSKCSSLKCAATLLREASDAEVRELLGLMAQQARNLADSIEKYEKGLAAR
jgi:uncharacterized heparinase superfamily protein